MVSVALQDFQSKNSEFISQNLHLESLSLLLLLNHMEGKFSVKLIRPKLAKDKAKGRFADIVKCLNSFTEFVAGFAAELKKKQEDITERQEDFMKQFREMLKGRQEAKPKSEAEEKLWED